MSICNCTTGKGTQCSFKAKYGPYCWHHKDIKTGIATLSKGCKTPLESPKYVQPQKVQPKYVQPHKVQLEMQQQKLTQNLKLVHHSEKKDELIYLCGTTDNCIPVENSDILLKFIDNREYMDRAFSEIIYKVLQQLYPQACFLHPLRIEFIDKDTDKLSLNINEENIDNNITRYALTSHIGRETESNIILDFERYKKDEIDRCLLRTAGQKTKPLIAIPMSIPGHANMLIVDQNWKDIEHFDPQGANYQSRSDVKVNKRIEKDTRQLCKRLFPEYNYIPRSDTLNFQAELNQRFENSIHGSTCAVWSLWYSYLRLSNPTETPYNIVSYTRDLLKNNDFAELENFIIKFMKQLTSLIGDLIQQEEDHYMILGRKILKN